MAQASADLGAGRPRTASEAAVLAHRGRLLERLADLEETLDDRLDQLAHLTGLTRSERPIALGVPRPLLDFLATAMAELEAIGRHDLVELLALLYGETMPLTLATQLAGLDLRCPWLMDEPLPLERLPRLQAALDTLRGTLDRCHPSRPRLPWEAWFAAPLRLADLYPTTFFGRLQPLFGTTPAVLAELAATPHEQRPEAIDRLLGPALLHEFLHFSEDRAPLWPPYLDEAIAGALGVHFLPETAFPTANHEALDGFLTFAQVGLALIDRVGLEPVLLAQAGLTDWDQLIPGFPPLRERALALYWPRFLAAPAAHLHPDWDDPRPFADLFDPEGPPAPSPAALFARASRALAGASITSSSSSTSSTSSTPRPGRVVPAPPPPTCFDFERGLMTIPAPHMPNPGAPKVQLLHRLERPEGAPRFELPAGATAEELRAALDAAGLFDPS